MKEPHTLRAQQCRELHVAVQIHSGILKQVKAANYNSRIYLCIYLDFLYTRRDAWRCGLCHLKRISQVLACPAQVLPCCIKTELFFQGAHNDPAVCLPEMALFSQLPLLAATSQVQRLHTQAWVDYVFICAGSLHNQSNCVV